MREFRRHIAHSDADAERRALRPADDFSDLRRPRTGAPDWIVRAGRGGAVGHLERDELLARAFGLLLGEDGAANELAFVQSHEEAQAGLDGVVVSSSSCP